MTRKRSDHQSTRHRSTAGRRRQSRPKPGRSERGGRRSRDHTGRRSSPRGRHVLVRDELNELANRFSRIRNFNVTTKELGHKVIFLRKLVEGGSKHSFGIHVAKMAGMPNSILARAVEILKQLEDKALSSDADSKYQNISDSSHMQLSIFETTDETAGKLKKELLEIDINGMTPIDCMMKLQSLKKIVEDE